MGSPGLFIGLHACPHRNGDRHPDRVSHPERDSRPRGNRDTHPAGRDAYR